uniref:BolA-like protein 3 n=1 Tax=Steinernema glaseri TaxID=37863 RepID=A0A1I7YII0_9BILA
MFRSALRTLVPLRGFVSSRLCSGPGQISEGEKKIADLLRQRFPTASSIVVDDISGGCGSMYQVAVESEDFKEGDRRHARNRHHHEGAEEGLTSA